MKSSVRAMLAICTAAAAVAAIPAAPALAATEQVECPRIVKEKTQIPAELDLAIYDRDDKAYCFQWRSDRVLPVDIRDVTRIHKDRRARSVTLVVERTMGDPRSAWETVYLDSTRESHRYSGKPAYRVHSISIRR